ncbi:hypothetical protein DSECCO2_334480 [anaerobic digester metagenome]
MNYRNSHKLMWGLFIAGILLFAVGYSKNEMLYFVLGTLCVISGIIQSAIFYRCPYCYKSLMDCRDGIPKYCPHCGNELD